MELVDIGEMAAKSGTKLVFVEAGCQWRNGLVERQVGSLKRSISAAIGANAFLNYAELETFFCSVANQVNQRPLAVRNFSQEDFRSITANDLPLGRNKLPVSPGLCYGDNDNLGLRLEIIEEMESSWWNHWWKQVFPSL